MQLGGCKYMRNFWVAQMCGQLFFEVKYREVSVVFGGDVILAANVQGLAKVAIFTTNVDAEH